MNIASCSGKVHLRTASNSGEAAAVRVKMVRNDPVQRMTDPEWPNLIRSFVVQMVQNDLLFGHLLGHFFQKFY